MVRAPERVFLIDLIYIHPSGIAVLNLFPQLLDN